MVNWYLRKEHYKTSLIKAVVDYSDRLKTRSRSMETCFSSQGSFSKDVGWEGLAHCLQPWIHPQ